MGSFLRFIGTLLHSIEQSCGGLPHNVTIGKHTYGYQMNTFFKTDHEDESITIGKFCSIASGVKLMGGGEHNLHTVSTYPIKTLLSRADGINYDAITKGPLRIGNDVWVGQNALILSGVTVGDGAVIGAMNVVTTDVPPYAIVAGNPARIIRYRFTSEQIKSLLKIAWWNWDDDRIISNEKDFYLDVDQFISKYLSMEEK